jgi:hypothetical protein
MTPLEQKILFLNRLLQKKQLVLSYEIGGNTHTFCVQVDIKEVVEFPHTTILSIKVWGEVYGCINYKNLFPKLLEIELCKHFFDYFQKWIHSENIVKISFGSYKLNWNYVR